MSGETRESTEPPSVLSRNIAILTAPREQEEAELGWQERAARAITRFSGSMAFVYVHLVVLGLWIAVNIGALPILPKCGCLGERPSFADIGAACAAHLGLPPHLA